MRPLLFFKWRFIFIFVPNDRIFFTAWPYHKTHQTWNMSHLLKNFRIYCRLQFPPLGSATIKEIAFWLITDIYCVAHSKTLYQRVESCYITGRQKWAYIGPFFANWWNVTNLLFPTPPRQFHWFAPNFANSICGLSWRKVIKRILVFQTILKLLKNFM